MYVAARWDEVSVKDASGVVEKVEMDWRWRGNFEEVEVLPPLPPHQPDPRASPDDYKNWMKLKFEYQVMCFVKFV